jgi:hypothetical protein
MILLNNNVGKVFQTTDLTLEIRAERATNLRKALIYC